MWLRTRRANLLPGRGLLLGEVRVEQMRVRGAGSDLLHQQRLLRGDLVQAEQMSALREALFGNGEKNDDGHERSPEFEEPPTLCCFADRGSQRRLEPVLARQDST